MAQSSINVVVDASRAASYHLAMAVQLTPAIEQKLHHLAAETHRSPDELAESAMEAFFADYEDVHREVKFADEEFERGEFLPHEEVVALFPGRFAKA